MTFSATSLHARLGSLEGVARWWVAYSGGLDSSVLLHAMATLRPALGAPLHAVHVDHGLHPDAGEWAGRCGRVCEALGVALQRIAVDVSEHRLLHGLEGGARAARYDALAALLSPGDCLLTAHHRDDQAETVLLQLLRGGGPAGVAGMPFETRLGAGRLLRPLLDEPRAALRDYALAHGVRWIEDPANADTDLDRNYLRHEVLPRLCARWPGLGKTLSRAARHAAEAAAIVDERAAEDFAAARGSAPDRLRADALAGLPEPRRRTLLRHWCRVLGLPVPDAVRLDEVLGSVLSAGAGRSPLVAWGGVELRRYRGELFLGRPLPPFDPGERLAWDARRPLDLPAGLGRLRLVPGGDLPPGLAETRLEVGFRAPGLTCRPTGRAGHRGLKKLFQAVGVPPWLRDRIPLVFHAGRLTAVADLWVCAPPGGSAPASGLRVAWDRGESAPPECPTPSRAVLPPGHAAGGL
jgi:tRNA(Ile)-lysidine synthase